MTSRGRIGSRRWVPARPARTGYLRLHSWCWCTRTGSDRNPHPTGADKSSGNRSVHVWRCFPRPAFSPAEWRSAEKNAGTWTGAGLSVDHFTPKFRGQKPKGDQKMSDLELRSAELASPPRPPSRVRRRLCRRPARFERSAPPQPLSGTAWLPLQRPKQEPHRHPWRLPCPFPSRTVQRLLLWRPTFRTWGRKAVFSLYIF